MSPSSRPGSPRGSTGGPLAGRRQRRCRKCGHRPDPHDQRRKRRYEPAAVQGELTMRKTVLIVLLACAAIPAFSAMSGFPAFVDVAEKLGITLMNICGGSSKDYIVEANGNGAAFFDYDNDGKLDVLI